MMYHSWEYGGKQTELFVILVHFLPFHPTNNLQNFEKMEKTPGDFIILQMCTINDNHTMYGSWDMAGLSATFYYYEVQL